MYSCISKSEWHMLLFQQIVNKLGKTKQNISLDVKYGAKE